MENKFFASPIIAAFCMNNGEKLHSAAKAAQSRIAPQGFRKASGADGKFTVGQHNVVYSAEHDKTLEKYPYLRYHNSCENVREADLID